MSSQRSQKETRHYVSPPDEQPFTPAAAPAPLLTRDAGGRVTDTASARALAQMPRGASFIPRDVACAPDFAAHNRRRLAWLRRRRLEIHQMTGEVSSGVGAMLAAAAWLYAGGEALAEKAAKTGDLELFKSSAALTATARTHDFGAWELAVREADARKKRPKASGAAPWLAPKESK